MKKLFKSRIFYFILGVTIAASITSAFAYSFGANSVGYTSLDSSWKTIDNQTMEKTSDEVVSNG